MRLMCVAKEAQSGVAGGLRTFCREGGKINSAERQSIGVGGQVQAMK